MTRASLAEFDPFFEPQVAHAPTILLDPAKMGVDTESVAPVWAAAVCCSTASGCWKRLAKVA